MSYKIKSLIYLSCFVLAIFAYNQVENETEQNPNITELNDINVEASENNQIVHLAESEE